MLVHLHGDFLVPLSSVHILDALENVGALRQAILQLAVMGKLVAQEEGDEPAYNLLKRIKIKKEQLIKENKIKKIEQLAPINKIEVPYILPEGWDWAHFGDLILSITGGGTPSKNNPQFWNGNIPWASVKDLEKNKYLETTVDFITEKGIQNSSTNLIPKGRVIICTRMGLGKIALSQTPTGTPRSRAAGACSCRSLVNGLMMMKYDKLFRFSVCIH